MRMNSDSFQFSKAVLVISNNFVSNLWQKIDFICILTSLMYQDQYKTVNTYAVFLWLVQGSSRWNTTHAYHSSLLCLVFSEVTNAGFRLACRLPHCRFDDDICSTAYKAPLAAEEWPSGKQRLANISITLPLCPSWQIADSLILFNSGAMPLSDKAKVAWPLRATILKQQAMITRHSGKAVSSKLVWNQHNCSEHAQLDVMPWTCQL